MLLRALGGEVGVRSEACPIFPIVPAQAESKEIKSDRKEVVNDVLDIVSGADALRMVSGR
jgi:hypothetical protein